jgi:hypothetical protein
MAAKVGAVMALVGSLLKWLLTPMFTAATRKALEPELRAIAEASTQFAAGDQRFRAVERDIALLQKDVRALGERMDDVADGRQC